MAKYSYGWEKLFQAVTTLTGSKTRSERLIYALSFDLHNVKPEEHLPEDIREEYKAFMAAMTSHDGSGGRFRATVEAMDEAEVSEAIDKVISFFNRICHARGPSFP